MNQTRSSATLKETVGITEAVNRGGGSNDPRESKVTKGTEIEHRCGGDLSSTHN